MFWGAGNKVANNKGQAFALIKLVFWLEEAGDKQDHFREWFRAMKKITPGKSNGKHQLVVREASLKK